MPSLGTGYFRVVPTFRSAISLELRNPRGRPGAPVPQTKKLGAAKRVADICCLLPWRSDQAWSSRRRLAPRFVHCRSRADFDCLLHRPSRSATPHFALRRASRPHGAAGLLKRTIASDATYSVHGNASEDVGSAGPERSTDSSAVGDNSPGDAHLARQHSLRLGRQAYFRGPSSTTRETQLSARCRRRSKSPYFAPGPRISRLPMRFRVQSTSRCSRWSASASLPSQPE